MKNQLYPFVWLGAISLFASGCIRPLDVSLPESEIQLVVNSHLTNDDILPVDTVNQGNYNPRNNPNVQLSISADPLNPELKTVTDKNAIVQITENGGVVASGTYNQLNNNNNGYQSLIAYYDLGSFKPKPNTTYNLRVKVAGYAESTASTTTTAAMQPFTVVHTIDSSNTNNGGGGPNGGRNRQDKFTLSMKDDGQTQDFYEIKIWAGYVNQNSSGTIDTSKQQLQLFSNNTAIESSFSGNALLADNTFNGQNVSIDMNSFNNGGDGGYYDPVTGQYVYSTPFFTARLYKITKERYLYQKSVRRQGQAGFGNPFAEPSFIYSNVSNSFGIFSFGLGRTEKVIKQ